MSKYILILMALLMLVACNDNGKPAGSKGGPCYENGTCDGNLTCVSDLCVDLSDIADLDTNISDNASDNGSPDNVSDIDDPDLDYIASDSEQTDDQSDAENVDEDVATDDSNADVDIMASLWKTTATGAFQTCGIKTADDKLYCWGGNIYGQLGDDTLVDKSMPTKITDDTWILVATGSFHTCGISSDKSLFCWGSNGNGELGDGTFGAPYAPDKTIPTKIGDGTWLKIVAGSSHSCGIMTDNKLFCWGDNEYGELGDGTSCTNNPGSCDKSLPTKVGDDLWAEITIGVEHSCGIRTDNKLFCWGMNWFGELGDGTSGMELFSANPKKIGEDNWITISAGWYHNCGIKADHKLYCWGNNTNGQIGDLTNQHKNIPVQISNDTWLAISAGGMHTCGIKTDNKLYCWGANRDGQLGDGASGTNESPYTADKASPTKIGDDTWLMIEAGNQHTCGIKTDNKLYCWGWNRDGQLGNGLSCSDDQDTCADKSTPTLVID